MKTWLTLAMLVACVESTHDAPRPDEAAPIEACTADAECSKGVCARTGECLSPDEVRKAQVIWTVAGEPPNDQSCYWAQTVKVEFWSDAEISPGETWESGPLPCTLGKFTLDKLPMRFWIGGVESRSAGMWVPLDNAGVARVNLP